jgi:gliding motility-associated-like protein
LLTEPTPIVANLVVEDPSCYGENDGSIAFENVTGGSGQYTYSLNVATSYTANLYYDLSGGIYEATIIDAEGCEWSNEVIVEEPDPFTLNLGSNQSISFGDSVQIIPQINSTITDFNWSSTTSISCDTCFNQMVAPLETTTYFLSVINEQGCEVNDEITITVTEDRPVYIPSAFTPNGDGFNDFFKIYCGPAVEQIKVFRVFNRWGALVYEVNEVNPEIDQFGWDGTLKGEFLENAVFIYYAEIQFKDGETVLSKGDVTLIR